MSTIYNVPYSTFSKRLTDWLTTVGGEVSNLTLDLANRGMDRLWLEADWEDLIGRQVLSLTDKSASLPDDFGRVVRVWHDSDSDGKPDFYYYAYANHDNGYYISDSFAKATGHNKTITFYRDPSHTPTVEYVKALTHFTAGEDAEYSFFPPDLLIRAAQMTHIEEADLVGNEFDAIERSYNAMLYKYKATHQFKNRDMYHEMRDELGDRIENDQYNLTGDLDVWADGYDNSYDRGLA